MYIDKDRLVFFVCSVVFFIANIDVTITNVALPSMAKSFAVDLMAMDNVIIGFLVAYAVSIPLVEFSVDRFGLKNILLIACLFFALSSFLCASSTDLYQLNCYRILQGISAGFFTPIARSVVVKISPTGKLPINLSNVQTLGMLGQAVGPFLGSYIISLAGWKYIFYLNIPLCFIAMAICVISFDAVRFNKIIIYKFDAVGYLIVSSIIIILFFILNSFEHNIYWGHKVELEVLFFFVCCLLLFMRIKFYKGKHILDYRLIMSNHVFRYSLYISFIARQFTGCLQFFIVVFFNSLYYQDSVLGYLLLSYGLGIWLSKSLVKYFFSRFKINQLIQCTLIAIFIINAIMFQIIPFFHNLILNLFLLLLLGLVVSLFHSAINVYSFSSVDKSDSTATSSFTSILMYVSQSSAIVVFSIILYVVKTTRIVPHNQYQMAEFALSAVLLIAYVISYCANIKKKPIN